MPLALSRFLLAFGRQLSYLGGMSRIACRLFVVSIRRRAFIAHGVRDVSFPLPPSVDVLTTF
jgi:hypothetical protein